MLSSRDFVIRIKTQVDIVWIQSLDQSSLLPSLWPRNRLGVNSVGVWFSHTIAENHLSPSFSAVGCLTIFSCSCAFVLSPFSFVFPKVVSVIFIFGIKTQLFDVFGSFVDEFLEVVQIVSFTICVREVKLQWGVAGIRPHLHQYAIIVHSLAH